MIPALFVTVLYCVQIEKEQLAVTGLKVPENHQRAAGKAKGINNSQSLVAGGVQGPLAVEAHAGYQKYLAQQIQAGLGQQ